MAAPLVICSPPSGIDETKMKLVVFDGQSELIAHELDVALNGLAGDLQLIGELPAIIGTRDAGAAYHFMHDLAARLANSVQLTTDGHKAYLGAVEDAFGAGIDYAMLVKIYGNAPEGAEVRYSPAQCMGARKAVQRVASRSSNTFPRRLWSARTSR